MAYFLRRRGLVSMFFLCSDREESVTNLNLGREFSTKSSSSCCVVIPSSPATGLCIDSQYLAPALDGSSKNCSTDFLSRNENAARSKASGRCFWSRSSSICNGSARYKSSQSRGDLRANARGTLTCCNRKKYSLQSRASFQLCLQLLPWSACVAQYR